MNIRRKVTIALLAVGTVLGYGSAFAHAMHMHCGAYGHHHDAPCERTGPDRP